jgi:hypothetical protein
MEYHQTIMHHILLPLDLVTRASARTGDHEDAEEGL